MFASGNPDSNQESRSRDHGAGTEGDLRRTTGAMPDLIPFAVIHIGVSIALAAMLAVAFAQSLLPFIPC
jgi:hypothetical protein